MTAYGSDMRSLKFEFKKKKNCQDSSWSVFGQQVRAEEYSELRSTIWGVLSGQAARARHASFVGTRKNDGGITDSVKSYEMGKPLM